MSISSNHNWPRMDLSEAERLMAEVKDGSGPGINVSTERFAFSGIGYNVRSHDVEKVRNRILEIAENHGFKTRHGYDQEECSNEIRAAFDIDVFKELPSLLPMNWSEAGSREVWSWFALALLPDVTHWRWKHAGTSGRWNRERWIGSDLTRHTWARQWWRAVQLGGDAELASLLQESEYNQLTERADTLGSNPSLLRTFGNAYRDKLPDLTIPRRLLIRDSTQRLLREMAFIEDSVLDDTAMEAWMKRLLDNSVRALTGEEHTRSVVDN